MRLDPLASLYARKVPSTKDAWVLILSVLVVLPHLIFLPVAVTVLCATAWLLAWFLIARRAQLSKALKTVLVVGAVSLLWSIVRTAGEVNLGFALVCLVTAMKPLETHDRRAQRSFVVLGFLCALLFFFQEQSATWLLYYAVCVIGLTGFLLGVEFPQNPMKRSLRDGIGLLAQALPLALVLFFVFPRPPEPLWQWTPADGETVTGIPVELQLHGLGPLTESHEIAFKAVFDDQVPEISSLYWRGPVVYFTDGRTWDSDFYNARRMPAARMDKRPPGTGPDGGGSASLLAATDETIDYRIRAAQNLKRWLIALDLPVTDNEFGQLTEDYQLVPRARLGTRRDYRMTSALRIKTPPDPEVVHAKALQLPFKARMAKRARSVGEALQAEFADDPAAARKIIQRLLLFFSEQPFYYTLDAPVYATNPIDEFLFEGRQGYCVHYAASMTLMLRAAAIPARMIMGYRGGEWDADTGELIVRQRHAHAWVEAWTQERGWLRIDPTAVIPDERVFADDMGNGQPTTFNERLFSQRDSVEEWRQFVNLRGIAAPRRSDASGRDTGPDESASWSDGIDLSQFANPVVLAQHLWNQWILDFNHERQQHLFGDPDDGQTTVILLAAVLAGPPLIYVVWTLARRGRGATRREQKVAKLYRLLCRRLAAVGIRVDPSEPHQVLRQRLAGTGRFDPQLLADVFGTYERLRYRHDESAAPRAALRRLRREIVRLCSV